MCAIIAVMDSAEWASAGGAACPKCRGETVRFLEGVCPSCFKTMDAERTERMEKRIKKRQAFAAVMKGDLTLSDLRRM